MKRRSLGTQRFRRAVSVKDILIGCAAPRIRIACFELLLLANTRGKIRARFRLPMLHCPLLHAGATRTQASAFHGLLIFNFRMRERNVLG